MNFEESYLGLIIETYEKEIMKRGDPKGYKVLAFKSVNDLKSVTSTSKKTLSSFPGSKYDLEKNPEDANKKQDKSAKLESLLKNPKTGNIPLVGADFNHYIEKCFGCDLRLQWDWQFLPPDGLMNPLGDLMDEILSNLALLNNALNSKKKIEQICALIKLFDGIPCPQDLLTLFLSLKMLLGKYAKIGLQLKLDWFALFGPIITSITGLLSYIVNFLFDMITAPLDCQITQFSTNLEILRILDSELFATSHTKGSVESSTTSGVRTTNESVLGIDQESFTNVNGSAVTDFNSAGIDVDSQESVQNKGLGVVDGKQLSLPSGATTGFSISGFLKNVGTTSPSFMDLSYPEQFLVGFIESKDYLTHLKMKILEVLNALNGLVGGKLLDIQNMSALIVIAEMMALVAQLLQTDFKTLCQPQNKVQFNTFVKSFIEQTDDSIVIDISTSDLGNTVAKITTLDGTSEVLTLKQCSSANTAEDIKQVENILAEIERLTRNE